MYACSGSVLRMKLESLCSSRGAASSLARTLSGPAVLRMRIEPPNMSDVVLSSLFYLAPPCRPVGRLCLVIGLMHHNHLRDIRPSQRRRYAHSFALCSALIGHCCMDPASESPGKRIREQTRTLLQPEKGEQEPYSIRSDCSR